jgi:hypothetical protein
MACQFAEEVLFDPESEAKSAWLDVFVSMPYTNLWMIDYLIHRASTPSEVVSYEDLCTNPKILKDKITDADILDDNSEEFANLPFKPGGCGSFAIQVSRFLQPFPEESPDYSFEYHTFRRHRLARCRITQIVIDSSSDKGGFPLADRDHVTYSDIPRQKTLRWTSSVFESESTDRAGKPDKVISMDKDSSSLFTDSDCSKPPKRFPPKVRPWQSLYTKSHKNRKWNLSVIFGMFIP